MKMSQVLSMSGDRAVSELHRAALEELEPMPLESVRELLAAEAPALAGSIRSISPRGIPASLGQVHRVRMEDGRDCALKIRYPGIAEDLDLDNSLMDLLLSVFGSFRNGFDLDRYRALIREELRGELDYPAEARRQERFAGIFTGGGGVVIPRPFPGESGPSHILMEWQASSPVGEFAGALPAAGARPAQGPGTRRELARLAALPAEFHLGCFFLAGAVHADPNPGNFGMRSGRSGGELVVYDFGSVAEVPARIRLGLPALISDLKQGRDHCLPRLTAMGFRQEPLEPIRDRLDRLCRILFEPFLADGIHDTGAWKRGERVRSLLGAERWNFMVAAPPELFPLMRAFQGLFHYAGLLGGRADFGAVMARFLAHEEARGGGWSPFPPASDARVPTDGAVPAAPAAKLRLEVRRGGERTVSLTMPGECAGRLEDLMEPDLLLRIRGRGLDPEAVAGKARSGGFKPGPLFEWRDGEMEAKAWLE